MAQTRRRRKRNTFRNFERLMTRAILGTLAVFVMMLAAAAIGIGWLKWLLALLVLAISGLGFTLLVLKQEHRRRRSRWMLASFVSLLICTLASLLLGFPAPPLA